MRYKLRVTPRFYYQGTSVTPWEFQSAAHRTLAPGKPLPATSHSAKVPLVPTVIDKDLWDLWGKEEGAYQT